MSHGGHPFAKVTVYTGTLQEKMERTKAAARFARCEEAYVTSHYMRPEYPKLALDRNESKAELKSLLARQGLTFNQICNEINRLEYLGRSDRWAKRFKEAASLNLKIKYSSQWPESRAKRVKEAAITAEPEPPPPIITIREMTTAVMALEGIPRQEALDELHQILLKRGSTEIQAAEYLAGLK